jgi:hypothetical protein
MSNFRKRAIALAAVICVALTSFASCDDSKSDSDTKNNTETTVSADDQNASSEEGSNSGETEESGESDSKSDEKDEDKDSKDNAPTLEHIDNDAGVAVITPFQSGSSAELAASGITVPDDDIDLDADDPVAGDSKDYKSKTDSRYCLWIDISKDSDYKFDGEFIDVYFKLKKDIPDKKYAVRFKTDFSSIDGAPLTPDKTIQGDISVGSDIEAINVSSENGFVAYGENVSAKAGDEVVYRLSLKNNPGMAAMLVWIFYDSNAMEVEDVIPAGEFADIAGSSASSGSKPQS